MKKALLAGVLLVFPSVAITAKNLSGISSFECMTANIFFEARGESVKGMKGVAKVTTNRVKSKKYPSTVCATVFQPWQFSWVKQQKHATIAAVFKGDLRKFSAADKRAYEKAATIAKDAMNDNLKMQHLDKSLWYHADYVKPKWARKLQKVGKIDTHIFYEEKGKK